MSRFKLVLAALASILCAGQVLEAHELKTKKGNRTVMHGHYTKGGHATDDNQPAANHNTVKCKLSSLLEHLFEGSGQSPPSGGLPDARRKKLKVPIEKMWREKYPPPTGWTPPPGSPEGFEYWKTKVTQLLQPTCHCNCGGHALGGGNPDPDGTVVSGNVIVSVAEYEKILQDDYEPLPTGQPAVKGMVVVYRSENKDTGPITHVAVVESVNEDGTVNTVKSVFGMGGTWIHPVGSTPEEYTHGGGGWSVYRAKP